ncbi:efflux RND transporter periplasmic adaptor subunit [Alistipes sp.]|uniref:efflux RND transporter periplasmic adaptor subunit n=1 Tax=Alistipes sp. TaxID=1872444 RepID=UPI003A8A0FD8
MEKRNKWWMALAAIVLSACSGGRTDAPFVRSVYLTRPVVLGNGTTRTYSGIVRAANEVNLGFKTPGQIARIHVTEGDYVRRGQLLAELDDADYRLAVEALQIQYDQLRDEVDRTRRLFEQRSVTANDFEKANAGLRQLGVQLQANRNKLDYTKLYAPTDGYVQKVNFSPAEMVDAGTAIIALLDVSRMEVEVDIPAVEYLRRDRFTHFACRAAGVENEIPLRLSGLPPKADGNQLYHLTLAFETRPDRQLTAGRNVEVCITSTDRLRNRRFALPLGAVFLEGDTPCVWVCDADTVVRRRAVVLDNTDAEGRAVVCEGLNGDEQIVRAGVSALEEGEKVRVVAAPSRTNVGGLL